MIVLTVDQQRSRRGPDRVPRALDALAACAAPARPYERTAGDEFQGVLDGGLSAAHAMLTLMRQGWWSIGVGVGPVDDLPESTRAGRGPAFLAARAAVDAAKQNQWRVAVRGAATDGGIVTDPQPVTGAPHPAWPLLRDAQAVAHLLAHVVAGRRPAGWEALDLIRAGATQQAAAERLGITRQAVGQRLASAAADLDEPGATALAHLLDAADSALTSGTTPSPHSGPTRKEHP